MRKQSRRCSGHDITDGSGDNNDSVGGGWRRRGTACHAAVTLLSRHCHGPKTVFVRHVRWQENSATLRHYGHCSSTGFAVASCLSPDLSVTRGTFWCAASGVGIPHSRLMSLDSWQRRSDLTSASVVARNERDLIRLSIC